MRVPAKNKVPDRPDAVTSFLSACDTRGAPLDFGVRSDYRGKRKVLEEQGGPKCLPVARLPATNASQAPHTPQSSAPSHKRQWLYAEAPAISAGVCGKFAFGSIIRSSFPAASPADSLTRPRREACRSVEPREQLELGFQAVNLLPSTGLGLRLRLAELLELARGPFQVRLQCRRLTRALARIGPEQGRRFRRLGLTRASAVEKQNLESPRISGPQCLPDWIFRIIGSRPRESRAKRLPARQPAFSNPASSGSATPRDRTLRERFEPKVPC
jgi:hypothetical protein